MLLSEMFGVERYVDFEVVGYIGRFILKEQYDGTERLWWRLKDNNVYVNADLDILYNIILKAPDNIIHLPPPLTDEQREQFKAIWTLGGRWLTKDKSGEVVTFSCKPEKNSYLAIWLPPNVMEMKCTLRHMYGLDVCSLVSWSDHEPYDIGKALGVKNE